MRLKVEINTREHFSVLGFKNHVLDMKSRWFTGSASITTYYLDELLGTKLRALYQRKKGRDLFDIYIARQRASIDESRIIECFQRYLAHENKRITRAEMEINLYEKSSDPVFREDIEPLITSDINWDFETAYAYVMDNLFSKLPGEKWKGKDSK